MVLQQLPARGTSVLHFVPLMVEDDTPPEQKKVTPKLTLTLSKIPILRMVLTNVAWRGVLTKTSKKAVQPKTMLLSLLWSSTRMLNMLCAANSLVALETILLHGKHPSWSISYLVSTWCWWCNNSQPSQVRHYCRFHQAYLKCLNLPETRLTGTVHSACPITVQLYVNFNTVWRLKAERESTSSRTRSSCIQQEHHYQNIKKIDQNLKETLMTAY